MASVMCGIKGSDGRFYQKSVPYSSNHRPRPFKIGEPFTVKVKGVEVTLSVKEIHRYFVVSRKDGKRIQTGDSFETMAEAVIEKATQDAKELEAKKSRKLLKDFRRNDTSAPAPTISARMLCWDT